MNFLFLFVSTAVALEYASESNVEMIFSSWMKEHNKEYKGAAETVSRYNKFKTNLAWINQRNTELSHMQVGLNEFADMTEEEFAGIYLHGIDLSTYNESIVKYTDYSNNPVEVTGKCATAVRNQGQCGSCWAFSAAGAAEGLLCIQGEGENAYGHVSPQELVDCCCSGCNGGWPHTALDYYKSHGYCKDGAYPYTARKGSCQSSKCSSGKGINGHVSVQEPNLVQAISGNMLSICIDAGGLDFMFYRSGMYGQDQVTCSRHSVNHAVLAVGGSSSSYHVKNSWGASWGSGGFFDMPANKNCLGVNNQASVYPRA